MAQIKNTPFALLICLHILIYNISEKKLHANHDLFLIRNGQKYIELSG